MIKEMMMELPLLPLEHFEAGYSYIKQFAKDVKLFEKLQNFFKYFDDFLMYSGKKRFHYHILSIL